MGSDFCTFEEAATRLCRSKRMIHNYVKKGLIRRKLEKDSVLLYREDVEQLAVELGSDMPAMTRQTFFQLMNRVRKLEEDTAVFKRMWDVQDRPLRPSNEEAIGLFNAATQAAKCKEWKYEELETWASMFDRMDEVFFDTVAKATVLSKPWNVFYNLCLNMMGFASEKNREKPDLQAQILHKKLDEGRKKMRSTVLMWIEAGRGTVPEAVFRQLNNDQDDLLRRLTAVPSKS
jgi:hypothetical protein